MANDYDVIDKLEKAVTPASNIDRGFVSIKNRAEEDRPREKLVTNGASTLSNAELLAILIGTGSQGKSAIDLMREIMKDCNNKFSNLSRMSIQELMSYKGIGFAKAITLKAAAEIGIRSETEEVDHKRLTSPHEIYNYMRHRMCDLDHEECYALFFNNNMRFIDDKRISSGGMTETVVDVRIILREALLRRATAIAMLHNHPSGSLTPSNADNKLTAKVRNACKLMNINFIDHLIVSDCGYYSYLEQGVLDYV